VPGYPQTKIVKKRHKKEKGIKIKYNKVRKGATTKRRENSLCWVFFKILLY
jgi:hypothetical protein